MDITCIYSLIVLISTCLAQNGESDFSIDELHFQSVITHRFATTHVTSQLTNMASFPREATFKLRLPKEAFISNFTMTIGEVVYPGIVDEKDKAKKSYDAAVERGESASHVAASPRDTNRFVVSVNVGASENVTFNLVYQELLVRKAGLYEHVIYIDPGVSIPDLWVDVYIFETREITELSVPQLSNDLLTDVVITDSNQIATVEMLSTSSAHITFVPTIDEQLEFSENGITGQFIVNYDVDHDVSEAGEILVSNGYFVHYFTPVGLEPMSKRLLFVLDTSGSMSGTKIQQLKVALVTILEDLRPEDEFGILTFSSSFHLWNSGELIPASEENVASGRKYAESLRADGGTNINAAILRGLELLSGNTDKPAMLLFLTDGLATSGTTNPQSILNNIQNSNAIHGVSIFSLAFGDNADYNLVRTISARNNGVARKIYEDADASLQLAGFYDEISSPILSDIQVTYIGESIENETVTKTDLHCFFDGTEMIIAGKMDLENKTAPTIDLVIAGSHISNEILIEEKVNITENSLSDIPISSPFEINDFTERLWVYLTVKQLIDVTLQATDSDRVDEAKKKALELSLKYNFVTPYTSMVVTKPGQDKDLKEVIGDTPPPRPRPAYGRTSSSGSGQLQYLMPAIPRQSPARAYHYSPRGYPSAIVVPRPRPTTLSGIQYKLRSRSHIVAGPTPRTTTLSRRPYTYHTTSAPLFDAYDSFKPSPSLGTKNSITTKKSKQKLGQRKGVSKTRIETVTMTDTGTTGYPPALSFTVKLVNKAKKYPNNNSSHLCLDIPREMQNSVELYLVQNNKTGLSVKGRLSSPYKEGRKFEEVLITDNNITILVSVKGVRFPPKPTMPWWQVKHVNKTGLRVTPEGGVEISLGKDFSIMVRKHGIQTRRSRARPFLTVSFNKTDGLTENTRGVLGEILKLRKITVTKNSRLRYRKDGAGKKTSHVVQLYNLSGTSQCYRMKEKKIVDNILNL